MQLSQKYRSTKWLSIAVFGALVMFLQPQAAVAKGKRITLDELVIEGNIQKPEAFFILPRAALNFDELQRRENLKNRIIESVKKKPF
jgi:hypothetical protein